MPRKRTPESGVLRACLDLLAAEKIWHRRWNSGAVNNGARFYRFGKKGDADIQFTFRKAIVLFQGDRHETIINTTVIAWIECKSEKGKQTDEQIRFEYEVGKEGHAYLLIRDVDELRIFLKQQRVTR